MTDLERVRQDLKEVGYSGFEFDSGNTAVPGLSSEWVSGNIPREVGLKHENQPLWIRILDALPGSDTVEADPENAPESIRNIATEHGLEVVIFSVSADDVVEYIADLAAGDAREGVALLRRAAAEIKEAAGRRGLTTGVVEGAERDIL